MEEQEAISRLKRGDISGLETLVYKYQLRAVRAAYLVTRDRHMAEDVVQTAFIRVYERRRQFDPARPFQPWFLRIVVNDAIKAMVRQEHQVSLNQRREEGEVALADLLPDLNPGPEELVQRAEVRQMVWDALGKLSAAQRAVVVLRYYSDLKEREIAERTGRASGTVKWLLHTARVKLRALLSTSTNQR